MGSPALDKPSSPLGDKCSIVEVEKTKVAYDSGIPLGRSVPQDQQPEGLEEWGCCKNEDRGETSAAPQPDPTLDEGVLTTLEKGEMERTEEQSLTTTEDLHAINKGTQIDVPKLRTIVGLKE